MARIKVEIVPVTPIEQNCAIVYDADTRQASVIDPGGDVPRIIAAIEKVAVTVDAILLTHGHFDHAGGAAELKEHLGVPVIGPDPRDAFLLDRLTEDCAGYGLPGRSLVPDRWLAEGETVRIAGAGFRVLHCPGHTPGHVVFVNEHARFAIMGDVLFQGSIGRTDFPYGDHAALIGAISTKIVTLGDDVTFICGHGPGSTIGAERRSNPFLRQGLAP